MKKRDPHEKPPYVASVTVKFGTTPDTEIWSKLVRAVTGANVKFECDKREKKAT
jgi:hypothetical protein